MPIRVSNLERQLSFYRILEGRFNVLNLKLLQTFRTAVDAGSFSSAAKLLNYSPSTVSKHITELENEIGSSLIVQNTLTKGLTPIGEVTYNYAIEAMVKFKDFKLNVSAALEKNTTIRIGGIERYLSEMVISKVISYQQQHNHIQFDLISGTSDETLDRLKDSALDIGIIADRFIPPSFEGMIIKRESLVLIASEATYNDIIKNQLAIEELSILIDKKASVIFDHVLKNNNDYQNIIHVEGDDMIVKGVKNRFCLGITSDGCFSPGDFHILKVYNENAPVRLIYPSKMTETESKKQFLYSLIRYIEKLNAV